MAFHHKTSSLGICPELEKGRNQYRNLQGMFKTLEWGEADVIDATAKRSRHGIWKTGHKVREISSCVRFDRKTIFERSIWARVVVLLNTLLEQWMQLELLQRKPAHYFQERQQKSHVRIAYRYNVDETIGKFKAFAHHWERPRTLPYGRHIASRIGVCIN